MQKQKVKPKSDTFLKVFLKFCITRIPWSLFPSLFLIQFYVFLLSKVFLKVRIANTQRFELLYHWNFTQFSFLNVKTFLLSVFGFKNDKRKFWIVKRYQISIQLFEKSPKLKLFAKLIAPWEKILRAAFDCNGLFLRNINFFIISSVSSLRLNNYPLKNFELINKMFLLLNGRIYQIVNSE